MSYLLNLFESIGNKIVGLINEFLKLILFIGQIIKAAITPGFYPRILFKQMLQIGFHSLPIVAFTSLFAGMVLALQCFSGFSRFSAESAIATVVVISLTRELGPVFAGLMVSGRSGAAISAELGTMKVSEQIDALRTLSTDPFKYLIVPRVLAAIIMMPILALIADIIGVFGGFLVSITALQFNPNIYISNTVMYLKVEDVTSGLIKATFFGAIIAIIACYQGYNSKGGAEGVGRATKSAVVISSILILLVDYLLTAVFFS